MSDMIGSTKSYIAHANMGHWQVLSPNQGETTVCGSSILVGWLGGGDHWLPVNRALCPPTNWNTNTGVVGRFGVSIFICFSADGCVSAMQKYAQTKVCHVSHGMHRERRPLHRMCSWVAYTHITHKMLRAGPGVCSWEPVGNSSWRSLGEWQCSPQKHFKKGALDQSSEHRPPNTSTDVWLCTFCHVVDSCCGIAHTTWL